MARVGIFFGVWFLVSGIGLGFLELVVEWSQIVEVVVAGGFVILSAVAARIVDELMMTRFRAG